MNLAVSVYHVNRNEKLKVMLLSNSDYKFIQMFTLYFIQ